MDKLMVYFNNGQKAKFDKNKVAFTNGGDNVFSVGTECDDSTFAALARDGKALVNWRNVCFIRDAEPEDP